MGILSSSMKVVSGCSEKVVNNDSDASCVSTETNSPGYGWEFAGLVAGGSTSIFLMIQLWHELHATGPSTLSMPYCLGFLAIFVFWALYGVRFRRPALYLTNIPGILLQLMLTVVCYCKS